MLTPATPSHLAGVAQNRPALDPHQHVHASLREDELHGIRHRLEQTMKTRLAVAAAVAAGFATFAAAQMGPGMDHRGMGPGMMGGQGMGPGMMGAQGMGPGMMGGPGGCGMGMMGGQGMGHGMMGGQGMMRGQGMGRGMMAFHDPAALERLGLNEEQRGKIRDVQRDLQRKHHALMGSMRDLGWQAEDNARSATFDEAAARKNYDAMAAIRKQAFEARLDARKRIEAVLTTEQRDQLRRGTSAAGPVPR
jgi:Spy/CpxP family protein refolding chaperone